MFVALGIDRNYKTIGTLVKLYSTDHSLETGILSAEYQ